MIDDILNIANNLLASTKFCWSNNRILRMFKKQLPCKGTNVRKEALVEIL
jgi:hypothetical protein